MRTIDVCDAPVHHRRLPGGLFDEERVIVRSGPILNGTGRLTATKQRAVLEIAGFGRVLVDGGEQVTVELEEGRSPEQGLVYNGTVAALVLGQRSRFALHAGAAVLAGKAIAVAGDSGAGKSTTTLALAAQGHTMLSDDLTLVDVGVGPGAAPMVETFPRAPLVTPEAAERLGIDIGRITRLERPGPKYALPAPTARHAPLGLVVELVADVEADAVRVERVRGGEAVEVLHRHVFWLPIVGRLWPDETAAWVFHVACRVEVHRLTRPTRVWSAPDVVDALRDLAGSSS